MSPANAGDTTGHRAKKNSHPGRDASTPGHAAGTPPVCVVSFRPDPGVSLVPRLPPATSCHPSGMKMFCWGFRHCFRVSLEMCISLEREMKPQMNADGHRFSRSYTNRSAHPTGETRKLRKSFIINVHLRPSAVLFSYFRHDVHKGQGGAVTARRGRRALPIVASGAAGAHRRPLGFRRKPINSGKVVVRKRVDDGLWIVDCG